MLALMGASGAGKTTLLDVIAGRKSGGEMRGTIKLNGHVVKKETFARLTAYCEQQDLHNAFTTVKEALEFSATLRLPSDVSKDARKAFVDEALDILELRGIENRLIGVAGSPSGLSPGQRKVLTVGVELVSNAPVFFLDEPTSGLDSRAALIVMREVKKVANLGRTVITTVHQPSKEIFNLFDDMLLLQRGGYQVYFGPCGVNGKTFVDYLQKIPNAHALPDGMNPASWMLDVLGGTDSSNAGEKSALKKSKSTAAGSLQPAMTMKRSGSGGALNGLLLVERFKASQEGAAGTRLVKELCAKGEKSEMFAFASPYARSFLTQLRCLIQRASLAHNRDVAYNLGRIGILFVLYLLFGFVYFDLDASNETGVQAMVGVIFMTSIFAGIIFMNSVMPVRVRERAVAYRERTSFMYDAVPYSLSHAICEVPWVLLVTFVTVTPLYFMVGLVPTFEHYIFHVLMVFTVSMAFMSLGQLIACLCATIQTAQAGASAFIPICFLFGGLYLPYPQIPVYWKWAYFIDPVAYAIQGVTAPQFEHRGCTGAYPDGDCPTIQAFRGTYFETVDTLAYVEEKYDVQLSQKWYMLIYVAIFVLCMQTLHIIAFKFRKVVAR
jgi:ABC-type multidrug transport system ATPase subunit